jgi:2-keto-3-deoxy-L-rhamnonate aldolase RhmA
MDDPRVIDAVEQVCAVGVAANRTIGMFVGRIEDVPRWRTLGASLFVLQSDQEFLLAGARALVASAAS